MTEQQFNDITKWQRETFPNAQPTSKLSHLSEELEELHFELSHPTDNLRLEFADCFLLLFGCASSAGMTYGDICMAIDEKMEINRRRKWGQPDENGVVKHID